MITFRQWSIPLFTARGFNIFSDFLGDVTAAVLTAATVATFGAIMAQHLQRNKHVPVREMGIIPQDFADSLSWARRHGHSRHVVLVLFLLALAEFANLLSDVGLNFVVKVVESTPATVLTLGKRNGQILFEATGDPLSIFTMVHPQDGLQGYGDLALATSFLASVDLIAIGQSPFLQDISNTSVWWSYFDYFGVSRNITFFGIGIDGPLAALAKKIPLDCASDQMSEIRQTQSFYLTHSEINSTALVPNCTFTKLRSSGIIQKSKQVNVTATARMYATQLGLELPTPQTAIQLITSRGISLNVTFDSKERKLARDRDNWRHGRTITSIKGVRLGRLDILFDNVVLAATPFSTTTPDLDVLAEAAAGNTTQILIKMRKDYIAVANIKDVCPPPPAEWVAANNQTAFGNDCLAMVKLDCEPFPEDELSADGWLSFFYEALNSTDVSLVGASNTSTCTIGELDIVWVDGVVVDQQLVAAAAGIVGRGISKSIAFGIYGYDINKSNQQDFSAQLNIIPAALFSLGTVEMAPSTEQVINPTVNVVWIVFMVAPWIVALLLWLFYRKQYDGITVPTRPWHLLVIGNEAKALPKRDDVRTGFPSGVQHLHFGTLATGGKKTWELEEEKEEEEDQQQLEDYVGLLRKVGNSEYIPLDFGVMHGDVNDEEPIIVVEPTVPEVPAVTHDKKRGSCGRSEKFRGLRRRSVSWG